jgi:ketol-acid reductoisomerase
MKVNYEKDASLEILKGKSVGIIGYGIQGKAQALNLRDSGINVSIANRSDNYRSKAEADGFEIIPMDIIVEKSDIVFVLIPDEAQAEVYNKYISPNLKQNQTFVFAHGYSLRYDLINFPETVDILLIAPRFPGKPIRQYYLNGGGVPVFFDVYQDHTKNARAKGLALCKAIGATKAGVFEVKTYEETEIDLFVEQFLIPTFIRSIEISYESLIKRGFDSHAVLSELFASGELGGVIKQASIDGLYRVFQKNASPTAQFGISRNVNKALSEHSYDFAEKVLDEIQSGEFSKALSDEGVAEYANLDSYYKEKISSDLNFNFNELNNLIKYREN